MITKPDGHKLIGILCLVIVVAVIGGAVVQHFR
jgi:hypothetical protein